MLGLGYPGGALIEELAKGGEPRFELPVPLKGDRRLEYSFSGLKNAVRVQIEKLKEAGELDEQAMRDLARCFEDAACAHILDKLQRIFELRRFARFGVVGGASANLHLRGLLTDLCERAGCEILFAPMKFCSDNAAMIARAAIEKLRKKEFTAPAELEIIPHLNLRSAFE